MRTSKWIPLLICSTVLSLSCRAEQPASPSGKIKTLLKEKLEIAEKTISTLKLTQANGYDKYDELLQTNLIVFETKLALAESSDERIKIYEKMLEFYDEVQTRLKGLAQMGKAATTELWQARIKQIDVE